MWLDFTFTLSLSLSLSPLSLPPPSLSLPPLSLQVEEYGREMYKLVKTFFSKWKQQKGKELGGGLKKEAAAMAGGRRAEEGDEFSPLRMARTAHEQVKTFKVSSATQHLPLLMKKL